MHPWLLVAGVLAVSLPVLIHLLNRRRFQVVDWAAMDFLLEADQESRRRIRLQHWLLLLLRSLAVVLVGLLLARPFLPTELSGRLTAAAPFERIIVLDDSLSMQARWGNSSAWETAKSSALDLIRRLTAQHGGKDTLTLLITSDINQPLVAGAAMTDARADEWQSRLEELNCSDGAVVLADALHHLTESLSSREPGVNRAVYVFTDLRQSDWHEAPGAKSERTDGVTKSFRRLNEHVQVCLLVDVAAEHDGNLTVAQIQADGAIVSDVRAALDVAVINQGSAPARNIDVKLFVDDGLPASETIQRLESDESSIVRFHPPFTCESLVGGRESRAQRIAPHRVRVELKAENVTDDLLAGDSVFHFPASVRCGMRALVVDGEPGTESAKSESFFLRRALAPAGPVKSGVVCEVITEDEVDSLKFPDHDLVFLLNVSRLGAQTTENLARLSQWVGEGGNLVVMPGDQTDAQWFNSVFWQNGQGLSPLRLISTTPDEGNQKWAGLQFVEHNKLLPRLSAGSAIVENVKIFRHWQAESLDANVAGAGSVVARFNDGLNSPAIAEKQWGDGRVVVFAIPADADWHDWPSHPSYVLMMQDLVHVLVGDLSSKHFVRVGEAIRQPVDLAEFDIDAIVEAPTGLKTNLHAEPQAGGGVESLHWEFVSPVVKNLGFYMLTLSRRSGGREERLFAANPDRNESDLKRADPNAIKRSLVGTNARLISADDVPSLTDGTARSELWRYCAWLLAALLLTEQALGWFFGRERT